MSPSRRAGGGIHILAKLDGATKARPKRALLVSGIAGVLACGLAGSVLWMLRTPEAASDAAPIAASSPAVEAPTLAQSAVAAGSTVSVQTPLTPPALAANAAGGATIVNLPDTARPAPPLASHPVPALPIAAQPLVVPAPHARPAPTTPPKYAAYRPAPHPVAAVAHAAPARRPPPAKAAPAPTVDTDVALISAIIQHAAAKHDGASDVPCGGKACDERSPGPR